MKRDKYMEAVGLYESNDQDFEKTVRLLVELGNASPDVMEHLFKYMAEVAVSDAQREADQLTLSVEELSEETCIAPTEVLDQMNSLDMMALSVEHLIELYNASNRLSRESGQALIVKGLE